MDTKPRNTRRLVTLFVVSTVVAIATVIGMVKLTPRGEVSAAPVKPNATEASSFQFDAKGELVRPTGYRKWTYVGTPLTPHDLNDGKAPFPEFHNVYINPKAFDHYEKTGIFPNGTVLVKELVSVGDREATSGNGYFMGEFVGLEVAIKEARRFPDEPGNWAYFSYGHKYPLKDTAKVQPAASCNDCHNGAADDDFVFTQYYPVLRAAKTQ